MKSQHNEIEIPIGSVYDTDVPFPVKKRYMVKGKIKYVKRFIKLPYYIVQKENADNKV